MRSLLRRLLVAVIRRTPAPKVTPREAYDRLVAELDSSILGLRATLAVAEIERGMRGEEAAESWRDSVSA